MASSKVMPTTSTTNPDPPRQHSLCSSLSSLLADLQDQNHSQIPLLPSTSSTIAMDDLLKNVYSFPTETEAPSPLPLPGGSSSKSVDEVWKEIVSGGDDKGITLEDFLTKAGAVREEDVRVPVQVEMSVGAYGAAVDTKIDNNHGGKGRHKRRAVEEPPMDKATQQKHKRMIKNRESAARSRERKQAYTIELESLVTQLEEENARLLREEVEKEKERLKELMENLIPVVEKRRPPRVCVLRRVNSVQW